jgi:hypothetical protein
MTADSEPSLGIHSVYARRAVFPNYLITSKYLFNLYD